MGVSAGLACVQTSSNPRTKSDSNHSSIICSLRKREFDLVEVSPYVIIKERAVRKENKSLERKKREPWKPYTHVLHNFKGGEASGIR